jgi:ribosomal subunit interface protein
MNITTKTTNIDLTPDVSDYLARKLAMIEKLIEERQGELIVHAVLARTTEHHRAGDVFKAEVNINIGNRHINAEAERDTLYAAIDQVKDELTREIKSNKEKRLSVFRRGAARLKRMIKSGKIKPTQELNQ